MAGLINHRAQAEAEQEAMSRNRGGYGGRPLKRTLFGINGTGDDFGRTSFFSKKAEIDSNFDPKSGVGNPYKENTNAGKRLNRKEFQNRIAEAEGMRMLQKQYELNTASDNNRSSNTINEHREFTKDELKKLTDVKTLERVAETEGLIQLGKARKPEANIEEALREGTRVNNTASMSLEDKRQAEVPYLTGRAKSKADVDNRENDSKDSKYFQDTNAATIAGLKSKAVSSIGSGGSLDYNNPSGPDIYKPSATKVINQETEPSIDANGNLVPGSKTQTMQQSDPGKVNSPPKINLGAYDPNTIPDLGSGNSERASAGGNTSTQTTNSNPTSIPQIAPIQSNPTAGSWMDIFKDANNTLEGSIDPSSASLPRVPVIPSLQAPVVKPIAPGSMEPSNSYNNPFEAPKANPFGIPAPQYNWDPNGLKPLMEDPVYGDMNSQARPNMPQVPKPNHMIPQIGNPLPQGAKPQGQLNVPDLLNLIRSYMSKPQTPAPVGFNRPGF